MHKAGMVQRVTNEVEIHCRLKHPSILEVTLAGHKHCDYRYTLLNMLSHSVIFFKRVIICVTLIVYILVYKNVLSGNRFSEIMFVIESAKFLETVLSVVNISFLLLFHLTQCDLYVLQCCCCSLSYFCFT